jgi:NAD(P)-dependent dehydrogenase (short-subunit alcohol dehydrogenase family)
MREYERDELPCRHEQRLGAIKLHALHVIAQAILQHADAIDHRVDALHAGDWQGAEERFAAKAMMGRIGEPEDIANAVVFLAAPELSWITARALTVDGGRMDYIGHA